MSTALFVPVLIARFKKKSVQYSELIASKLFTEKYNEIPNKVTLLPDTSTETPNLLHQTNRVRRLILFFPINPLRSSFPL
jgi:hypothetical protein